MGYEIRTLATLATQARQFFTQSIPGALVRLWPNTFTVLGKVLALLDFEHELRRQRLFKQYFVSTADERAWVVRHGFELGLSPDPGSQAVGNIVVAAPTGTLVPVGMSWVRSDGVTYTSLAAVTAAQDIVTLALQADLPGAIANMQPGDTLTAVLTTAVPEALATTGAVDVDGIGGGTDPEDIETFRAQVLYRKRNPPQGGSAADYTKWAGEALSTVRDVFVDSFQNDARSVWVCFTVSDQIDGIPTNAEVAIVQAYLDDTIRRPVTARVFAVAPTPVPQRIEIKNLTPYTPDTAGAIEAELAALFRDDVRPATPDDPGEFTLYREQVDAAIARATGVKTFTLTVPSADQTFTTGGQMPTLGDIVYTS